MDKISIILLLTIGLFAVVQSKPQELETQDVSNAPLYLDVTHAATTIGALIAILPQGYVHMNVVKVMPSVGEANEFCL